MAPSFGQEAITKEGSVSMNNISMSDFLVQGILKKGLVNTIVGPSGAGKSKFIHQANKAMIEGRPFLGHNTSSFPRTHYVGLDRPDKEMQGSIAHANLQDIPHFTYESLRKRLRELDSINKLVRLVPDGTEHLIIDGIGFLVKDVIKQREIGILFADLDNWIELTGATVTLIHHTAKAKQGQGYSSAREKGLGSGAWAQCSAVSILIEQVNPFDVKDCRRTASIMQNDAVGDSLALRINTDGTLELDPDVVEFTREELRDLTGADERTLTRRIEQWVKEGLFERTAQGQFRGRLPIL